MILKGPFQHEALYGSMIGHLSQTDHGDGWPVVLLHLAKDQTTQWQKLVGLQRCLEAAWSQTQDFLEVLYK